MECGHLTCVTLMTVSHLDLVLWPSFRNGDYLCKVIYFKKQFQQFKQTMQGFKTVHGIDIQCELKKLYMELIYSAELKRLYMNLTYSEELERL